MLTENVSVKGRCLCGAIHLLAEKASRKVTACHCNMCRRWTGGPLLMIDCGSEISVTGSDKISVHQTSELGERAFCCNCGSGLYYRYFENNKHFVPAGLFDFDGFEFDSQIFIDERPSYYCFSNKTRDLTGKQFCNLKHGSDTIKTLESYSP